MEREREETQTDREGERQRDYKVVKRPTLRPSFANTCHLCNCRKHI